MFASFRETHKLTRRYDSFHDFDQFKQLRSGICCFGASFVKTIQEL